MAEERRHSRAADPIIVTDEDQLARLEAFNTAQQYLKTEEMIGFFLEPERPFKLRMSHILTLHRAALEGISPTAGMFRPSGVGITGSRHTPPDAWEVPERIEELCDYVNDRWMDKKPLHLASYVMWKLNWIHPFPMGMGGRRGRCRTWCCAFG